MSTKPTGTFSINITDASYNPINQNQNTLTVSTNTPSFMSTQYEATLTSNTTGAGQYAKYLITIYPKHDIQTGGGLQITYPSQITLSGKLAVTVDSYVKSLKQTFKYDTASKTIIVNNAFKGTFYADGKSYINITIEGFQNPLANTVTDSFVIQTFNQPTTSTTVYYFIDWIVSGLSLNSACNYPCRTCDKDDPSSCTSCYSSGTLNKLQDNTCVTTCSLGKFFN